MAQHGAFALAKKAIGSASDGPKLGLECASRPEAEGEAGGIHESAHSEWGQQGRSLDFFGIPLILASLLQCVCVSSHLHAY